jgi:ribonuclease HI
MTDKEDLEEVTIYTDGGCLTNPGPGGYGVVLLHSGRRRELSGGYKLTTNNRMELMAVIKGLESLKEPCQVTLHSDSRYVVDGIQKGWAKKWQANNWWRTKSERAINPDLWEELLAQCERHQVHFLWVKGHAGVRENERCDYLSNRAAKGNNLPEDEGYDPDFNPRGEKITQEGQPCRKCATPVVKRIPKRKKPKGDTYFEYYFLCPNCGTNYYVEEARREVKTPPDNQLRFF